MSQPDRRAFLVGSAGLVAGAPWQLVADRLAGVDPRLRSLARQVRGPVITPASATFGTARLVYNERFDGIHPLGVVRPLSIDDVRAVVTWSRKTGVPLAVRSGGHSYAGYSTGRGLVLDLSRLSAIALRRASGQVSVGAGARVIDVVASLAGAGRAIPTGSCPTVGLGGSTLGGGVGFASRKFGTTSDNVLSFGIVTADGRYRRCNKDENQDLFWACRGGGGGNFGVVTDFVFRTHAVSAVSYFSARWPWAQAADVIDAWQRFAPHAPDDLFSVCAADSGPSIRVLGQYFGSEMRLKTVLAPLIRVDGIQLTVGSLSYLDAQMRWAGCAGETLAQCQLASRSSFAGKSDYVNAPLTRAGIDTITTWLQHPEVSRFGSGALLLDSYGGAINRIPADATAFVHRNALCSLQYLAYWSTSEVSALNWIRSFHHAMQPHVSGFAYQNYIDADLTSWRHAYYGSNYPRLQSIKASVDPARVFRFAQGIEP